MEKAVLDAALQGDEKAFDYIYNHTIDKAHSVAYGVIRDSHDAMDIVQEAYIKMWQNLGTLQDPACFEAWFFQIVRHKALDFLDKNKRQIDKLVFSDVEGGMEDEEFSLAESVADNCREFSPEALLDYSETQRILWGIVNELPKNQRECVLLRFRDNMKIREIAEVTGLSQSTVKSCLNYGQKKIGEALRKLEKSGTKLYGITPLVFLPFLRWMLGSKAPASQTVVQAKALSSGGAAEVAAASGGITPGAAAVVGTAETVTAGTTASAPAVAAVASAGVGAVGKIVIGLCVTASITAGAAFIPVYEGNTALNYVVDMVEKQVLKSYVSVSDSGSYNGILLDFSYELPQMDIDTPQAEAINRKIWEDHKDLIGDMRAIQGMQQEFAFLKDVLPAELLETARILLPDKPLFYCCIYYSGTVKENVVTLTVTVEDSQEIIERVYTAEIP